MDLGITAMLGAMQYAPRKITLDMPSIMGRGQALQCTSCLFRPPLAWERAHLIICQYEVGPPTEARRGHCECGVITPPCHGPLKR